MLNVESWPRPTNPVCQTEDARLVRHLAIQRAQRYAARIPAAVSGRHGHDQTFSAAVALVHGFALRPSDAWPILQEYNTRCTPPWSDAELRHKLICATQLTRHTREPGYLLTTNGAGTQIVRANPPPVLPPDLRPPSSDLPGRTQGHLNARQLSSPRYAGRVFQGRVELPELPEPATCPFPNFTYLRAQDEQTIPEKTDVEHQIDSPANHQDFDVESSTLSVQRSTATAGSSSALSVQRSPAHAGAGSQSSTSPDPQSSTPEDTDPERTCDPATKIQNFDVQSSAFGVQRSPALAGAGPTIQLPRGSDILIDPRQDPSNEWLHIQGYMSVPPKNCLTCWLHRSRSLWIGACLCAKV